MGICLSKTRGRHSREGVNEEGNQDPQPVENTVISSQADTAAEYLTHPNHRCLENHITKTPENPSAKTPLKSILKKGGSSFSYQWKKSVAEPQINSPAKQMKPTVVQKSCNGVPHHQRTNSLGSKDQKIPVSNGTKSILKRANSVATSRIKSVADLQENRPAKRANSFTTSRSKSTANLQINHTIKRAKPVATTRTKSVASFKAHSVVTAQSNSVVDLQANSVNLKPQTKSVANLQGNTAVKEVLTFATSQAKPSTNTNTRTSRIIIRSKSDVADQKKPVVIPKENPSINSGDSVFHPKSTATYLQTNPRVKRSKSVATLRAKSVANFQDTPVARPGPHANSGGDCWAKPVVRRESLFTARPQPEQLSKSHLNPRPWTTQSARDQVISYSNHMTNLQPRGQVNRKVTPIRVSGERGLVNNTLHTGIGKTRPVSSRSTRNQPKTTAAKNSVDSQAVAREFKPKPGTSAEKRPKTEASMKGNSVLIRFCTQQMYVRIHVK